jgi:hypothetical protein
MTDFYQRFAELLAIAIVLSALNEAICWTACARQIEACPREKVTNRSSELRSRE